MHALIVVETMASIIVTSLMIRIVLHRTRLSLEKRGIVLHVMVAMVQDDLVVVSTITAEAILKGASFE